MLYVTSLLTPKQKSALLPTTRMIATPATSELGLVLEENSMTPTLVETRLLAPEQIMEINISEQLDTF